MAGERKINTANDKIRLVTSFGIGINIVLSVSKFVVGFLTGSISLVADGFHSLSDMVTDVAVLLGIHFGAKEPDSKHPYGHGRVETFTTAFIAVVLIIVGAEMIRRAAIGIAKGQIVHPSYAVLAVAALSVLSKEVLYRLTRRVAVQTHSSALYANAWHHRSDAFSSVAVIIGVGALKYGFKYGDHIAAVTVGLMIILVGSRILGDCFNELIERAVDDKTILQIEGIIKSNGHVRQWHKLRTRVVGREVFIDLHILVDPALAITDAHSIAESLESMMHHQINRPVNIIVHVEPDIPGLRK
ncbi:MAG: cation diffusion facilitator family transporter [Planctomycetota bacterium]